MKIAPKHPSVHEMYVAGSLKSLLTLAVVAIGTLYGAAPALVAPILAPDLASFAVLGAAGVTNVPVSTIGGNLGSAPNASVGGGYVFTSGSLQANTATAQQAQLDLDAAIVAVSGYGVGITIPLSAGGNLDSFQASNGGTIGPGTYTVTAQSMNLMGDLILDGAAATPRCGSFSFRARSSPQPPRMSFCKM